VKIKYFIHVRPFTRKSSFLGLKLAGLLACVFWLILPVLLNSGIEVNQKHLYETKLTVAGTAFAFNEIPF